MKKIELPIELEKGDSIRPGRPDIGWLVKMLLILLGIAIFTLLASMVFSRTILAHISIEKEREYFGDFMITESMQPLSFSGLSTENVASYFEGYPIYKENSPEQNAYATLGANIIVTEWLLENIENEEELLFILVHEKAHIDNRDILSGFAKSAPISLALGAIGIDTNNSIVNLDSILQNSFSRSSERAADNGGIDFLLQLGLNTHCATQFFERNSMDFEKYMNLVSSHPDGRSRIETIESANAHPDKACTPLSPDLKNTTE